MKKIISVLVAVALVAVMSLSIFAAETGTMTVTVPAGSEWWYEVKFTDIFDFSLAEGCDTLTITVEGANFTAGYKAASGEWVQPDASSEPIVIDLANCELNADAKACLSPGATGDYVLTWTLSKADESADASDADTTTPAEDTTAPAEDTTAPAEDTTAPAADETSEPAKTGIVLALLPMAVAAAAVVVSKRK